MEPRSSRYKKKSLSERLSKWFVKLNKSKKVAIIIIAVLLVTATGASAWYYNRLTDMEGMFPDVTWPGEEGDAGDTLELEGTFNNKIINIALLGFDSNDERVENRKFRVIDGITYNYTGLPDTIMVAAINIETGDVDVVSIPRDTLVTIYNRSGQDKINAANWYGFKYLLPDYTNPIESGLKSQLETIRIALGGEVPIHYYVTVEMNAVVEIVDIMGGVYLDVPEITYHKYGRVIAEPGYQWFSGRRFLDYVRSREAEGKDIARIGKQQQVMIEVFDQFKQANKLVNAPQVLTSINNNVTTSLSLEQIMALALFGTQKVNSRNIGTHTLAGKFESGTVSGRRYDELDYYVIDQQARVELVKEIWGIDIEAGSQDQLLPVLTRPEEESDSDDPLLDPELDQSSPDEEEPDPSEMPGEETPGDMPPEDEDSGDGDPETGPGDDSDTPPDAEDSGESAPGEGSSDPADGLDP